MAGLLSHAAAQRAAPGPARLLAALWSRRLYATSAAPPPGGGEAKRERSRQLSALARYGRDLTAEARRGLLDPVIGRRDVISRTLQARRGARARGTRAARGPGRRGGGPTTAARSQVLLRRAKHNPLLIGEAGVGKTAIAEGIAQLMAAPEPMRGLGGKRLIALDVASVVAGATYRGEFEERLQALLHDCEAAAGSVVLFIDEIHVLVGTGNVEGGLDFANMLKPALARSALQVIGATTLDEYRQHIETDPALNRRFQARPRAPRRPRGARRRTGAVRPRALSAPPRARRTAACRRAAQPILVEEPSPRECLELLAGLAPRYEAFHRVTISQQALATAVAAAQRYVPERRLPDSALDLLDEAAAKVRLAAHATQQDGGGAAAAAPQRAADGSAPPSSSFRGDGGAPEQRQEPTPALGTFGSEVNEALGRAAAEPAAAAADEAAAGSGADRARGQEQMQQTQQQQTQTQQQQTQTPPALRTQPLGGGGAQHSWSDWITAKGWRGESEVHRQQLLEWFGASPAEPLPGVLGHRQTTEERRKKHAQLFSGSTAQPGGSAGAGGSQLHADFTRGAAPAAPAQRQARGGDTSPRSCPHCGTLAPVVAPEQVVLTCGSCRFRFLNVAPEKLQLGTTVLLDKQQQRPLRLQAAAAAAVQQGAWGLGGERPHRHEPAGQPPAGAASATATAVPGPPGKRAAVAVQQGRPAEPGGASGGAHAPNSSFLGLAAAAEDGGSGGSSGGGGGSGWGLAPPGAAAGSRPAAVPEPEAAAASGSRPVVGEQHILEVVSEATGIPLGLLAGVPSAAAALDQPSGALPAPTQAVVAELDGIHAALTSAVLGQDAAAAAVVGALRLSRLGLQAGGGARCALSLLLVGPSGVGKSSMAKALAECLMPGERSGVLHLSCGELGERHSISRLVGAPPGYVGYGKGGLLTEAIRRRPHSVVRARARASRLPPRACRPPASPPAHRRTALRGRPWQVLFDDIERAHPDVVGLLLQVRRTATRARAAAGRAAAGLRRQAAAPTAADRRRAAPPPDYYAQAVEEGRLMDSLGHSINLRSTTMQARGFSSAGGGGGGGGGWGLEGAELDADDAPGGAPAAAAPRAAAPGGAMVAELGSRVDDVVRLAPLGQAAMREIVAQQLATAAGVAAAHGVLLAVDDGAAAWLARAGCSRAAGARPLAQLVRSQVMVPLASCMTQPDGGGAAAGGGGGDDSALAAARRSAELQGLRAVALVQRGASGAGQPLALRFERL
ncbi:clpB [Scenedesmus sp. PABB004]|nr:clpB [Scenedesmus sp. PABB004]